MKQRYFAFLAALLALTGLAASCACTPVPPVSSNPPSPAPTAAPSVQATPNQHGACIDGHYTYEFSGVMGTETMQLDFANGKVTLSLPGHPMIRDVYESTYAMLDDGSIAIEGFVNTDPASPYLVPGLWDWIDTATGACIVTLDPETGTFCPRGVAAVAETGMLYDLAYAGLSDAQKLDLALPQGDGPFPLVILVHGGGFKFGDKQMSMVQKMYRLIDSGFAVASVNYRLSGEAIFPAALSDVKAAVRFLRANAAQYGLDPERFAIWGESAGAYLAAMTAVTDDETFAGDVANHAGTSSAVSVLVDFYGPISFVEMDADAAALGFALATDQPGSFESAFLGKPVGTLTAEEAAPLDPISYLSQAQPLAVWIQAGAADTSVPHLQSERFAQACQAAFGDDAVYYALLPDAGHMDEAFYTDDNLDALIAFLNEHL